MPGRRLAAVGLALTAVMAWGFSGAFAQERDPYQAGSPADSLTADADTTAVPGGPGAEGSEMTTLERLQGMAADPTQETPTQVVSDPFFMDISNVPKTGATANVRQYTYYTDLIATLKFRQNSTLKNTFKWSWEDYRKQDRQVENRSAALTYASGNALPMRLTTGVNWRWSDDQTVNSAGFLNQKNSRHSCSKTKNNHSQSIIKTDHCIEGFC